jgi:tellurite resistance protein TehA-like permease
MGVPLAFLIMSSYFLRLCIYNIPPREQIVSVFLPVGPCGQGAFGLLQLSTVLRNLAHREEVGLFGGALSIEEEKTVSLAIYGLSLIVALMLWGLGLFWLIIAVGSVTHMAARKGGFPFNMGWWGKKIVSHC